MTKNHKITKHKMFHDPNYPPVENLTAHQRGLVETYNNDVQSAKITMEEVPCLCGADDYDIIATYDRYRVQQTIVLCHNCGLMQCRPRYTEESNYWFYNSDFFRKLYTPGGFSEPTQEEFLEVVKNREPLRQRAMEGLDQDAIKSVAEVGCANGINLYGFHQEGREVFGCDYSPVMTAMGRKMGMDLREGGVDALGDRKFDLIILSHVLEHMRDPICEVEKIKEHLSPNGALYIEVPDASAFYLSSLQSAHLYYFTPQTLTYYMNLIGLAPVSQSNANNIHFGIVFKKTMEPVVTNISGEYERMRNIILSADRRNRIKDVFVATRLLGAARVLRSLVKRG